nr:hypothetical protein [Streptomyces sp. G44]
MDVPISEFTHGEMPEGRLEDAVDVVTVVESRLTLEVDSLGVPSVEVRSDSLIGVNVDTSLSLIPQLLRLLLDLLLCEEAAFARAPAFAAWAVWELDVVVPGAVVSPVEKWTGGAEFTESGFPARIENGLTVAVEPGFGALASFIGAALEHADIP